MTEHIPPSIAEIRSARALLGARVRRTPTWEIPAALLAPDWAPETRIFLKLELFQYSGTFKPRGALLRMLELSPDELARGVTAVSAGNHALAVAFAARSLSTTAKVVMPRSADPLRVEGCRTGGAEVVLVDDVHQAFDEVARIREEEGRAFVHPFEGPCVALGTGGVGLELVEDAEVDLDAVVVPIGGGGLCSGVATAVKELTPACEVWGVEPEGADTMHRSFAAGRPQSIDAVRTIADSLGAPHAEPYSFALCRRALDGLVKIDDPAMVDGMRRLLVAAKLAVEPAGAATTAALLGPLRERLEGKTVGLIVCGANIAPATFAGLVGRGA